MPWYRRRYFRCLGAAVMVSLAAALPAAANPIPTEPLRAGGRVVPAKAIPVDLVSEDLQVAFEPQRRPNRYFLPPYEATVSARYVLRADRPIAVPVLFPILGGNAKHERVEFRVNGREIPHVTLTDLDLLGAYELIWQRAINKAVASDPTARAWCLADSASTASGLQGTYSVSREQARAWLQSRGAPQVDRPASHLISYLTDRWPDCMVSAEIQVLLARGAPEPSPELPDTGMLLDDPRKPGTGSVSQPGGPREPSEEVKRVAAEMARRFRLWAERDLAIALDPHAPDPMALWGGIQPLRAYEDTASFAAGRLELKRGRNYFTVLYTQPAGFANRKSLDPEVGLFGTLQVPRFEYILRTARFWRAFGDLRIRISLPEDTRWVECSLPGATSNLEGPDRWVAYVGKGVPEQNLSILFAPCANTPYRRERTTAGRTEAPAPDATKPLAGTPPGDMPEVIRREGQPPTPTPTRTSSPSDRTPPPPGKDR